MMKLRDLWLGCALAIGGNVAQAQVFSLPPPVPLTLTPGPCLSQMEFVGVHHYAPNTQPVTGESYRDPERMLADWGSLRIHEEDPVTGKMESRRPQGMWLAIFRVPDCVPYRPYQFRYYGFNRLEMGLAHVYNVRAIPGTISEDDHERAFEELNAMPCGPDEVQFVAEQIRTRGSVFVNSTGFCPAVN